MKYFFEEPDGCYIGSEDRILRTNSLRDNNDRCPIGRWGKMHDHYLKTTHPELYEPLILNGTFHKHLADANERAESILERPFDQMKQQKCMTERLKAEQPMVWGGRRNHIRNRAKEIVLNKVIHSL